MTVCSFFIMSQYDRVFGGWIPDFSRNSVPPFTSFPARDSSKLFQNRESYDFEKIPFGKVSGYVQKHTCVKGTDDLVFLIKDVTHGVDYGIREMRYIGERRINADEFPENVTLFSDLQTKELLCYKQDFDLSPPF